MNIEDIKKQKDIIKERIEDQHETWTELQEKSKRIRDWVEDRLD